MRYKFWLLPAIMLVLAPQPALARARDEVMAGVFRCAAIGDTRLWLDCYYGAAQPVRAELAMPPVPTAQARLALSPPAGGPAGDMTARYQTTSAALRCNSLTDDRAWLDCYYGAAQPVRAQLGLSPAPQARAQSSSGAGPSVPVPGTPVPAISHAVDPQWSRMTTYSFNHYGIFTVTLANGQVWRQLSGDTDFAHWTKPAASYAVRVTHGALGSFNLKVKGGSEAFKVQQVN
jgi:hypothetical protein